MHRRIGEEYINLAVLHTTSRAAVVPRDADRLRTLLQKAALVDDADGITHGQIVGDGCARGPAARQRPTERA